MVLRYYLALEYVLKGLFLIQLGRQKFLDDSFSDTQTRLYAYNEFNILDTKTWTWLSPKTVRGEIAHPRYDASAGLLYGKYWVILGGELLVDLPIPFNLSSFDLLCIGISEFTWTNDMNVLEIPKVDSSTNSTDASGVFTWLYNITDPALGLSTDDDDDDSRELGGGAIAGIVMGSLAAAVLVVTLACMLRQKNGGTSTMIVAIWDGVVSMIWDRR